MVLFQLCLEIQEIGRAQNPNTKVGGLLKTSRNVNLQCPEAYLFFISSKLTAGKTKSAVVVVVVVGVVAGA